MSRKFPSFALFVETLTLMDKDEFEKLAIELGLNKNQNISLQNLFGVNN